MPKVAKLERFIALEPLALGFGGEIVRVGTEMELSEAQAAPLLARKAITRVKRTEPAKVNQEDLNATNDNSH